MEKEQGYSEEYVKIVNKRIKGKALKYFKELRVAIKTVRIRLTWDYFQEKPIYSFEKSIRNLKFSFNIYGMLKEKGKITKLVSALLGFVIGVKLFQA